MHKKLFFLVNYKPFSSLVFMKQFVKIKKIKIVYSKTHLMNNLLISSLSVKLIGFLQKMLIKIINAKVKHFENNKKINIINFVDINSLMIQ